MHVYTPQAVYTVICFSLHGHHLTCINKHNLTGSSFNIDMISYNHPTIIYLHKTWYLTQCSYDICNPLLNKIKEIIGRYFITFVWILILHPEVIASVHINILEIQARKVNIHLYPLFRIYSKKLIQLISLIL